MNREHQDDIIDLGSVTAETKGGPVGLEDSDFTYQLAAGLTDD